MSKPTILRDRWPRRYNLVTREDVRARLEEYDRRPFGDVLNALLQARPSIADITKWARNNPERWARAVQIFGTLAGFTERRDPLNVNVFHQLANASDADLYQKLLELEEEEKRLRTPRVIEAVQIPNPPNAHIEQMPQWAVDDAQTDETP